MIKDDALRPQTTPRQSLQAWKEQFHDQDKENGFSQAPVSHADTNTGLNR